MEGKLNYINVPFHLNLFILSDHHFTYNTFRVIAPSALSNVTI